MFGMVLLYVNTSGMFLLLLIFHLQKFYIYVSQQWKHQNNVWNLFKVSSKQQIDVNYIYERRLLFLFCYI